MRKQKNVKHENFFRLTTEIQDSILAIHSVVKILSESKVDERVIHLLIKDRTRVPLPTIEKIFKALKELPDTYLVEERE